MRFLTTFVILFITAILSALFSVFAYQWYLNEKAPAQGTHISNKLPSNQQQNKGQANEPGEPNFNKAAETATPAVVHIKSTQEVTRNQSPRSPLEEMLREFYGDQFDYPQQFPPQSSFGSGVIVSKDGYIVTNNHVIQKADKIEVILNDNRSYIGSIVGTDPTTDLAVIKIKETQLPYIRFGKSEALKIGDWVVAVGNPFNLNSTVTAGIVSAKGRAINIIRGENRMGIESFIQTDAVVNPGNSGGALVNTEGELIGINTAIASPTGAFAGYAFAVPETIVQKVVNDLTKYGVVQRAFLGVMMMDLNADLIKNEKINSIKGVYISDVVPNGAAQKAGLRKGDVITKIDSIEINSASRLQELIAMKKPGDKIKISILRNNKNLDMDATLTNQQGKTTLIDKQ